MIRLAKRLTHNLNGTTDQADAIMIKSVSDYTDKEIIQNQVDTIFNNYPLPLALTIELPEKGTYKTLDIKYTNFAYKKFRWSGKSFCKCL